MPTASTYPGFYIEELPCSVHTIEGVATSIAAFVGIIPQGPSNEPWSVCGYDEFESDFGRQDGANALAHAVGDFFLNGGRQALIVRVFQGNGPPGRLPLEEANYQAAFEALRKTDLFNLLCLPPADAAGDVDAAVLQAALKLCVDRRAFLILDPRSDWLAPKDVLDPRQGLSALGLSGDAGRNAAVFFPRLKKTDPTRGGRMLTVVPCGAVAGVMARTDAQRGVWKAPAGKEAVVKGIQSLSLPVTDLETNLLKTQGVNCIRSLPTCGPVLWSARTLSGNDPLNNEYKYIPVRRLALFIEETLYRSTQWAAFEPNSEHLWSELRLNIDAFMQSLFRQGAFQGTTPREAYFVQCGGETTTPTDVASGIVNIVVGFAPLKPSEFVLPKLQQRAGQISA